MLALASPKPRSFQSSVDRLPAVISAAISTICSIGKAASGRLGQACRCRFLQVAEIARNYKRSKAAYQEAIAKYRQQILVAFGEVENSLAGIHHLSNQAVAQNRAVTNSRRAADLATQRYRSGLVSYLEVRRCQPRSFAG